MSAIYKGAGSQELNIFSDPDWCTRQENTVLYSCSPCWTQWKTVDCVWDGILHAAVTRTLCIENLLLRACFVMTPCIGFNFYWLDEVNRSIVYNFAALIWAGAILYDINLNPSSIRNIDTLPETLSIPSIAQYYWFVLKRAYIVFQKGVDNFWDRAPNMLIFG